MRRGERRDFVVHQPGLDTGVDDVGVADRGGLSLAPHDPDGAVRPDARRQGGERLERGDGVCAEQDDVGVWLGPAFGHVGRPIGDERADVRVVDVDEGDAHPRPQAELVEQGSGVDPFHRRYRATGMLLVHGPRSTTYDFGPGHPLTPRRFGPAIDLLRAVGAEPGLAPEPAPDDELLLVHAARYLAAVKRLS